MPRKIQAIEKRFFRTPSMTDAEWDAMILEYMTVFADNKAGNLARISNASSEMLDKLLHMDKKEKAPAGAIGEVRTVTRIPAGKKFRASLTAQRFGLPFMFETPLGFRRKFIPDPGRIEKPIGNVCIAWAAGSSSAGGPDPKYITLPVTQQQVSRWTRFYQGLIIAYLLIQDAMLQGHTFNLYFSPYGTLEHIYGGNEGSPLNKITFKYPDKEVADLMTRPFATVWSLDNIGAQPVRGNKRTRANFYGSIGSPTYPHSDACSAPLYFYQSMDYQKAMELLLKANPEGGGGLEAPEAIIPMLEHDIRRMRRTSRPTIVYIADMAKYSYLYAFEPSFRRMSNYADIFMFQTMEFDKTKMEARWAFDLDDDDHPKAHTGSEEPDYKRFDPLIGQYDIFTVVGPEATGADLLNPDYKGIMQLPRNLGLDLGKEVILQEPVQKNGDKLVPSNPASALYKWGDKLRKTRPQYVWWEGRGYRDRRWFKPFDWAWVFNEDWVKSVGGRKVPYIHYVNVPDGRYMMQTVMQSLDLDMGGIKFSDVDDAML